MDSLCYATEGKELMFSDDIEFPDFNNNILVPIREGDGEIEFTQSDLPNMTQKSFLDHDLGWSSTNDSFNSNISNPFSRFPSSPIRPRDHTLPKIDLTQLSCEKSASSSPETSLTPKRSRNTNLQSQVPVCQVHSCNKDLSLSKDYHKRHRVCDAHSKTAVVIVNGVEQRFCQQCSRFHLLAEFDKGKRSCRERLAGHNKRRRKLQLDTRLGPFFLGADLSRTPFFLPGSFFPQQSIKRLKYEEELTHISQLATPVKFWQTCAKSHQDPTKNSLNSPLLFQELSRGSNSSYALSLLSDQSHSHNSLRNASGILKANCTMDQDSNGVVPSVEVAETMNLVELSSRLQRVEQQRNSALVKQENDMFRCSTII